VVVVVVLLLHLFLAIKRLAGAVLVVPETPMTPEAAEETVMAGVLV